jgi:hypothetical protein
MFERLKISKKRKEPGPLVSRSGRLNLSRQSPMRAQHHVRWHDGDRTPPVATSPRGRGFIIALGRAEGGLPHFAFVHVHAPPSLCSAALCWCQSPLSTARTRCCIPRLCLHVVVLVDLTTDTLDYCSVLPSPVHLHRDPSAVPHQWQPTSDRPPVHQHLQERRPHAAHLYGPQITADDLWSELSPLSTRHHLPSPPLGYCGEPLSTLPTPVGSPWSGVPTQHHLLR